MGEPLTAVDREKARAVQAAIMVAIARFLGEQGADNVLPDEVFNGLSNTLCWMLNGLQPGYRLHMAAQCARLVLDHAGCSAADILREVDRQRPLAAFVEGNVAGNA